MTVNEKRDCVAELKSKVSISVALKAVNLNRSSYYYQRRSRKKRSAEPLDQKLVARLKQLKEYELTLGYQKITAYINIQNNTDGYWHNKKKVYRHMKNLKMLQPKVIRKPKAKKQTDVFFYSPIQSNVRWESDLSCVASQNGVQFLFTVIDSYDKEIIGDWLGPRCRANEAVYALEAAIQKRFPQGAVPADLTLVLRLDRGCQFTSDYFGNSARKFGLKLEFCDIQAPNQKPFIESFFANFKREEVYRNDYQNAAQVIVGWKNYVVWYNTKRPHASLGYLSPLQFKQRKALQHSLIST